MVFCMDYVDKSNLCNPKMVIFVGLQIIYVYDGLPINQIQQKVLK